MMLMLFRVASTFTLKIEVICLSLMSTLILIIMSAIKVEALITWMTIKENLKSANLVSM